MSSTRSTTTDAGHRPDRLPQQAPALPSSAAEAEVGRLSETLAALSRTLEQKSDALAESQARLMQIANNLPVMISYLDRQLRFRFANNVYQEWIGIAPEDLLGRSLEEVYGPKVYGDFRHHLERGLAGERVVYERTMSGTRHVEGTLVPHWGDDGSVQGLFVLIRDVTAKRMALELQARSEERLTLALEGSGAALFDWDMRQDLIYRSAQAAVFRGRPAVEGTSSATAFSAHVHPEDMETLRARLALAVAGRVEHFRAEYRVRAEGGRWVWLRAMGRVVERDPQGQALRLAGTETDITREKAAEDRLRALAETDTLTGLPNRGVFIDRLSAALARQARSHKLAAVLFIDIDHFKAVNDTFGHDAGDELLIDFAQRLRACVREGDVVARLAGDEFTIILEGLDDEADVALMAHQLVECTRRTLTVSPLSVAISSSIGIALLSAGETDVPAVLRRADAALYEAKRGGRDRYAFETAALESASAPAVKRPAFDPKPRESEPAP